MSNNELAERLDNLEMRYTHQESALDELTRTVLTQERQIKQQTDRIERLEKHIRSLQSGVAVAGADEKPPHY
jgi:uncharacterized coiled-coil protein SlyX